MANFWFPEGLEEVAKGVVGWSTGTIKARFVTSLPDSTITTMDGVTGVGTDQTLSSCAVVKDDTLASVAFVAAPLTSDALTAGSSIVGAVVYQYDGGGDSLSIPLVAAQFGPIVANGGSIAVTWPTVAGTSGVVAYLHAGYDQHVAFTWSSAEVSSGYWLKIGTASSNYNVFSANVGDVLTHEVALAPASTYYAIAVPSTTAEQTVVTT